MIFERFEILDTLSRRHSVQTYRCRDAELGEVVLKVFEGISDEQRGHLRALSESLGRFSHRGIQRHLGLFEQDQTAALAFEWVEGKTLAQEIELGVRYSDEQLTLFLEDVLEALVVAHTASPPLVHRDIKPENLVHAQDGWVLIDFGASREAVLGDGEVSVIGTTGYAAPEQFFGSAFPASDQYGLAATTLHLATHRHPTDFPLRKLRVEIDKAGLNRAIQKVLERMLAPTPAERFPDTESALQAVRSGAGMQEWEFALEPIADSQTVLKTTAHEHSLQIEIGPRIDKKVILTNLAIPVIGAAALVGVLLFKEVELAKVWSSIAWMFFAVGLAASPMLRREWNASKTWLLELSPQGSRLLHDGKLKFEGSKSVEVVQTGGLMQEMDSSLSRRSPLKLKDNYALSVPFGFSLTEKEAEILRDVVATYFKPWRPAPNPKPRQLEAQGAPNAIALRPAQYLQKLSRPSPLRWLSNAFQTFQVLEATPRRKAYFDRIPQSARTLLDEHGFRSVGYLKESVLGVLGKPKEVFLSSDGSIAIHVGPGAFGESDSDFTYYMYSSMDDGKCRLTWSHRNPSTPTQGLVYSAGSLGSFEKDLEAHKNWIAHELLENHTNALTMTSLEERIDALKLHTLYAASPQASLIVIIFGTQLILGLIGIVWILVSILL